MLRGEIDASRLGVGQSRIEMCVRPIGIEIRRLLERRGRAGQVWLALKRRLHSTPVNGSCYLFRSRERIRTRPYNLILIPHTDIMLISRRTLSSIVFVVSLLPVAAAAQAPAPPPEPPPPLSEGTAEFAYVGTSGNSQTESIGLGGEYIYRPDSWTITTKAVYVRNKSEEELKAESFDLIFKASRALNMRLSAFGRYGFLHDRFAGIEARNVIEGGLSYVLVNTAPNSFVVDGSFGYAHETRIEPPNLSDPTAAADAHVPAEAVGGRGRQRRRPVRRGAVERRRLAIFQHRGRHVEAHQNPVVEGVEHRAVRPRARADLSDD